MSEPTFTWTEAKGMIDEAFTRGFNAGYIKGWNQILDPDVKAALKEFERTIKAEVGLQEGE